MNEHALKLYQYNTWANASIYAHLEQLPETIYTQEVKSVFPSIAHVLQHIYIIDKGWNSVLTKEYAADNYATIQTTIAALVSETTGMPLLVLKARQKELAEKMEAFISSQDMSTVETYAMVKMSLADVVMHIVNHGSYHRGNISAMLHQSGHAGVPTDFGYYLYTLQQ